MSDWGLRKERNEASRNKAGHYAEPWLGWELDLLMQWDGTEAELEDLAELLGRTIEACRQHFYITRKEGQGGPSRARTATRQAPGDSSPCLTPRTVSRAGWSEEDLADYPAGWYE
jgi:hypothetical protein